MSDGRGFGWLIWCDVPLRRGEVVKLVSVSDCATDTSSFVLLYNDCWYNLYSAG